MRSSNVLFTSRDDLASMVMDPFHRDDLNSSADTVLCEEEENEHILMALTPTQLINTTIGTNSDEEECQRVEVEDHSRPVALFHSPPSTRRKVTNGDVRSGGYRLDLLRSSYSRQEESCSIFMSSPLPHKTPSRQRNNTPATPSYLRTSTPVKHESRQDVAAWAIETTKSFDSFESNSSHGSLSMADCTMAEATRLEFTAPPLEEDTLDLRRSWTFTRPPALNLFRENSYVGFSAEFSPIFETEEEFASAHKLARTERRISPTDVSSFPFMDLTNSLSKLDTSTPVKSPAALPSTPLKARPFGGNSNGDVVHSASRSMAGLGPPPTARKAYTPRGPFSTSIDGVVSPRPTSQPAMPVSRFAADFSIIGQIGTGSFGTVYKVRSRLDGCTYAIKAAKRPAKGIADRDRMLKEVHALAALSDLGETGAFHIVRYHQAWIEDSRLYIQTELCTSTLQLEMSLGLLDERRRYKVLREILVALELIHRKDMVHLDIKPENIFIRKDQFKLGDFGLVSKITRAHDGKVVMQEDDVEEGDSRYMSRELLSGEHPDLTKSDIFSLGATLYEACLGQPLPANGEGWHAIRNGQLAHLPNTSYELKTILKAMMHPDPSQRPDAKILLQRRPLLSDEQQQLIIEQNKVAVASRRLAEELQMLHKSIQRPAGLIRRATWDADTMNRFQQG